MQDKEIAINPLTERERQCLKALAQGLRLQELSDHLGISIKTAEKHVTSARKKLGASTREHAVAIAIKQGYLLAS